MVGAYKKGTSQAALDAATGVFVENYGGVGDGVTDNKTAFNNARTAANALGVPVRFGKGDFLFDEPAMVTTGDCIVIGVEGGGTRLIAPQTCSTNYSAVCINVDYGIEMDATMESIVAAKTVTGTEITSSTVNTLTINSGNSSTYDKNTQRMDRSSATYATTAAVWDAGNGGEVIVTLSQNHDIIVGDGITTAALAPAAIVGAKTVTRIPAANQIAFAQASDPTITDQVGTVKFTVAEGIPYDVTIDGTTLAVGFDTVIYQWLNVATTGARSITRIRGDGVTGVSVNGGARSAGAVATLTNDTAAFVEITASGIDITTGITPVLNGQDILTRIELATSGDAVPFSFGKKVYLSCNIAVDCSGTGSEKGYEADGGTVQGVHGRFVYLNWLMDKDYNSATLKYIRLFPEWKVHFENILTYGQGTPEVDGAGSSKSTILISTCVNPQIINCGVANLWNVGWYIRCVLEGLAFNFYCPFSSNSGEQNAVQYGLAFDGWSKRFVVNGLRTTGLRHPITTVITGVSSFSNTVGNWQRNGDPSFTVVNAEFDDTSGNGIDSHKNGKEIVYDGFRVSGGNRRRYGTIVPKAIQHRHGSGTYRNGIIERFGNAVEVAIEEIRTLDNTITFENILLRNSLATNISTTQRTWTFSSEETDHTGVQTVKLRNITHENVLSDRYFDSDNVDMDYVIENCDFTGMIVNTGGWFIQMDGHASTGRRRKLILRNCTIDTTNWLASPVGLIQTSGKAEIVFENCIIRGTNYSTALIVAQTVSGFTNDIIVTIGGNTQVDQVLPEISGTGITISKDTDSINGRSVDYQEFTADGTWTKPTWANATSRIYVELIGGGGGGGGGARVAAAGTATGGAGGGAGNAQNRWIRSTDLTSTVAITIGLGGAGGAGGASEPSAGSNGVAGGNTSFGSYLTSYGGGYGSGGSLTLNSGGGGGGGWAGAGTNGAPNTTGTGGTGGGSNGGNGVAGSSANSNTTGGAGGSGCLYSTGVASVGGGGNIVAGGGSAGGGVLVGTAKAGADSPVQTGYTSVAGGAATGAAGTAASAAVISPYGTSGGGGGANGAGVGGAAGAGTGYGAGGSGGGAAIGGAGGAGAAGRNGIVRVWTYA